MNALLPSKLILVHMALSRHAIPHAFGGAIALAFYGVPRGTRDLDINIALPPSEQARVLDALATLFLIEAREKAARELLEMAQAQLMWDQTGVDLFMADIPFHDSIAERSRTVRYEGTDLPIISAEDLIILKAAFNRTKDWVDIENIFQVQQRVLDSAYIRRWLSEFYLPPDDLPLRRVEDFLQHYGRPAGPESS
jgi:hypothetical protein